MAKKKQIRRREEGDGAENRVENGEQRAPLLLDTDEHQSSQWLPSRFQFPGLIIFK